MITMIITHKGIEHIYPINDQMEDHVQDYVVQKILDGYPLDVPVEFK